MMLAAFGGGPPRLDCSALLLVDVPLEVLEVLELLVPLKDLEVEVLVVVLLVVSP